MMKKLYILAIFFLPFSVFSQQFENPGFEFWEDAGTVKDEPVDWSSIKTCDDPMIASVAPVTFDQSTDAHSGEFSLKLYNVNVFNLTATGAISNGRFHAEFDLDASYSYTDTNNALWNTPITTRPDSLAGWFKYFPEEDDKAQFKVILHVDDAQLPENGTLPNWVGMAVFQTERGVTYDTWTRFVVPFEYFRDDNPEFLLCVLNSGDSTSAVVGSYLLADDLELIYDPSGVGERPVRANFLRVAGRDLLLELPEGDHWQDGRFELIDMGGRKIYKETLTGQGITTIPQSVPAGIYIAVLETANHRYAQKIQLGQ